MGEGVTPAVVRARSFVAERGDALARLRADVLLGDAEPETLLGALAQDSDASTAAASPAGPIAGDDEESTGERVAKTDIVVMSNGDRITGEVKSLSRGLLQYSTNAMGTLQIQWDSIASVTSVSQVTPV